MKTCYTGALLYFALPSTKEIHSALTHLDIFSCRFVVHCFLPLEDSMTLKRCPAQKVLGKSSQNQTETLKHTLVTTLDAESYFQHTLEIPFTVSKCQCRNTRDDLHQCHCSYPQRTQLEVWIIMEDLASTDCQVLVVLMVYLQGTGKKAGVIPGLTIRRELNSFTIFFFLQPIILIQITWDTALYMKANSSRIIMIGFFFQ